MHIEVVTDGERLKQIGPEWQVLWQESHAGVFQAHCWIMAWWNECRFQLRIACAWQDDRLIAVLPLCVHRWKSVRVLEWAAQPYSDYCDAVVSDDANADVLHHMWQAIEALGGYDLVRLKHVHPDAAIKRLLRFVGNEERTEVCLQVTRKWPNGDAWIKTLNKKTRNNLARGKRVLAEYGDVVFRQLTSNEPRKPVIDRLLALKRLRKENLASPLVRSDTMLFALVTALDRLGSLRIFLLEHDGVIIAGSVNAIHDDKMLALFATYDPQFAKASPGILLMTDYTQWAFDHGFAEVDYLLGSEPYKFGFANRQVGLHIFVTARTLFGRFALAVFERIRRHQQPELDISIGSAYLTKNGTPREPKSTPTIHRHTERSTP